MPTATPRSAVGNSIRRDAIFVLIRMESCATATPNSAGTICFMVMITEESASAVLNPVKDGIMPIFFSAGS